MNSWWDLPSLSWNIEGLVAPPLFLNYLDGGRNGALPSEKSALVLYILGLPFSKVGLMESLLLNGISGYWRTIHPPSTIFGDLSSRPFTVLFWIVFTSLKIDRTDFILQGLRLLLSYFCIPQKFPNCPTPQPVAIIWNFRSVQPQAAPVSKFELLFTSKLHTSQKCCCATNEGSQRPTTNYNPLSCHFNCLTSLAAEFHDALSIITSRESARESTQPIG